MPDPLVSKARLHHAILRHIVDHGFAPTEAELAALLGASEDPVVAGLAALADDHGVVLHPGSSRIWVIHPFSLAPTNFVVRSEGRSWWGNCAWCSLGVAALLERDVTITSNLGAQGRQVEVRIVAGEVQGDDLLVHFPVPMREAWDNVVYTCSTMLLFENEADVDAWCRDHRIPKGDVRPLSMIWPFSRVWYGTHLNPKWRQWTADEAAEIFARFGLDGPIWEISKGDKRF